MIKKREGFSIKRKFLSLLLLKIKEIFAFLMEKWYNEEV